MYLSDLLEDEEFMARIPALRHPHRESIALEHLATCFVERPEVILQKLVEAAVDHCGANSAGISLEEPDEQRFRWIAIAGSFQKYRNGTTPRHYSPCGVCLDTGRSQHYKLLQPYYDFLGVIADPILDGMLIPWETDTIRGTIWAVSHESSETFDLGDFDLLKRLANFVSLAIRHRNREMALHKTEIISVSAAQANDLAHAINNPLQCLTNCIHLARQGGENAASHLDQAAHEVSRLSDLVAKLLQTRR
jgi:hypothetical protein